MSGCYSIELCMRGRWLAGVAVECTRLLHARMRNNIVSYSAVATPTPLFVGGAALIDVWLLSC